jgi:AcrR family transcriptional regulator
VTAAEQASALSGGDLTRHRILVAASRMFAERGYHGTSTTQIAAAVGIKQPSLFFHFPSKQAIVAELLESDLGPAVRRLRTALRSEGSPAARLYAFMVCEIEVLGESPYDMRGPYSEAVLGEPGLEPWLEMRAEHHALERELIVAGQEAGEFRDMDPDLAQQMLTAAFVQTIWAAAHTGPAEAAPRARALAEFLLRALLADGVDPQRVIEDAAGILCVVEAASAQGAPPRV